MLRIAICDDIPQELQSLESLINQYISSNHLDVVVMTFSHPDALLLAIEEEHFHLYLLDIVMPMVNGLELGKVIRRIDRDAQIIFATTEPQFALQAYAASPLNYLVKPIDKQRLFDTLNLAISKVEIDVEQTFNIKTLDSMRVIKLSNVVCCEYNNHSVIFNLTNGEELVSRTMRENFSEYILPILKDKNFLKCHNSFVVNMRRVERFTKNSFTMYGGMVIPISPKQYSMVRDIYMDYLMAKGDLS